MFRYHLFFLFLIAGLHTVQAQYTPDTTTYHQVNAKSYIVPGALMVTGVAINEMGKHNIRDWFRDRWETIPTTSFDDYLQHAPIAMMYLIQGINDPKDLGRMSKHLLVTEVITLGTVYGLKTLIGNKRPNGGKLSFPSGHTAHAFAGATVMYHALKDDQPVLAYLGFLPAATTGVFRLIKDKHWVSDVLFGAGVGIAVAHLTYQFNILGSQKKSSITNDRSHQAYFQLGSTQHGAGLSLTF